jgi:hypothetical protein
MPAREPTLGGVEDMSALIFVALAVAWAAYLIPKALRHHGDASETRAVETFSDQMRVIARREPTSASTTRLVVAGAGPNAAGPEELRARRAAAAQATRRRRRVLSLILIAGVVVGGLAVNGTIDAPYAAIPAGLLVAWLIACRVMVKSERRGLAPAAAATPSAAAETPTPPKYLEVGGDDDTTSIPRVSAQAGPPADPTLWDPVPVTLPTYVTKPAAARRTVRSIDLESSGVWTSGRTEVASRIAREAEKAERLEKSDRARDDGAARQDQAAVGS